MVSGRSWLLLLRLMCRGRLKLLKVLSRSFLMKRLELGNLEIKHYQAVALDLENIHETYEKINLPKIHGIIGGDVLATHKAVINYRLKKIRIWA